MNEPHAGPLGLVGQELAELGEGPGVQRGPLGLAKPYPLADSRQLLDSDPASGALASATMLC